jgi:hypothetical protein
MITARNPLRHQIPHIGRLALRVGKSPVGSPRVRVEQVRREEDVLVQRVDVDLAEGVLWHGGVCGIKDAMGRMRWVGLGGMEMSVVAVAVVVVTQWR